MTTTHLVVALALLLVAGLLDVLLDARDLFAEIAVGRHDHRGVHQLQRAVPILLAFDQSDALEERRKLLDDLLALVRLGGVDGTSGNRATRHSRQQPEQHSRRPP